MFIIEKMHRVMMSYEVFTIKFLTGDTILKPRAKVASDNKTEIQVLRNHIPCPRILKLIRRNKRLIPLSIIMLSVACVTY